MIDVEIVKKEEACRVSSVTLKIGSHVVEAVIKEFCKEGSQNFEVGDFICKTVQPGGTVRRRVEIAAENAIRKGVSKLSNWN